MNRRRKAFTLLELLTVIGVILVLMTIAVIGFNHVGRSAAVRSTGVALENAKGLVGEFETTSDVSSLLQATMPGVNINEPFPLGLKPMSLGDVTAVGINTDDDRYGAAVQNTCYMMSVLARLPHNKQSLSQLPAKALLTDVSGQPLTPLSFPQPIAVTPPIICLVDGWNNPIIFVPPQGLVVNINSQGQNGAPQRYLVRSSGMTKFTGTAPITLPTDRPFWASAGPDGNFTNGDDNIYSFNN